MYDGLRRQRWRSRSHRDVSDLGVYGTVYKSSGLHWFLDSRFRYVFPTFLVTLGCHLASGLWSGVSSTYICPLVVGQTRTVPLMQFVAAALDCHLAITAYGLCLQKPGRPVKGGASILLWWGFILLVCTISTGCYASHTDVLCFRQLRPCGLSSSSSPILNTAAGLSKSCCCSIPLMFSPFSGSLFFSPRFVSAQRIV